MGENGAVIAAVVFDLDGVLIDSEPVWERVRRSYVGEHGGSWPAGAQERLMGMSTAEWARYLSEEAGVDQPPEEVAAAVIGLMADQYAQELPLISGALDAVERCGRRWPLGLASSSPRSLIDTVLATAGLAHRFAVSVSSEEVARGKPAPDVYLAAVAGLGLAPGQCVAVEDSTNGVLSAAAAGLAVVAIPRPGYPPSAHALRRAAIVVGDLAAVTATSLQELEPGGGRGVQAHP
jgi:HAD superfamily hydrolase (TIGR01509 family)